MAISFGIYFGVIWYAGFFWYLFWRYIKILVFWWYLKCSYNWKIFVYWAIGHIIIRLQYMNVYKIYVEQYSSHHMCCISIHLKSKRKCPGPTWLAMRWSMWEKKIKPSKVGSVKGFPRPTVLVIFCEKSTQPNGFSLTQSYKETRHFSFSRVTNPRALGFCSSLSGWDLNLASLRPPA